MCAVMKMYMWFRTGLTLKVVELGGPTHTKPLTSNLSTSYSSCRLNSVPDLKGIAEDRLPLVRLPLTAGKEEVCGRRIVDGGQRPARV
jgi:hypothetical protein